MIIVEGNDNSGKSTLIQRLSEELKLTIVKSYHRPWTFVDIQTYENWLAVSPQTIILDRHPLISDLVYGPIIRRRTASTLPRAKQLVALPNTFLIYCRPPLAIMTQTLHERGQLEGVSENYQEISYAYDDLMYVLNPHFTYDFTNPNHFGELIDGYTSSTRTHL